MDARTWNATPAEVASPFACDALGFAHDDVFHRAIDIAAPPQIVFAWLCQLRVAPYSYDWIDNFGRRSPPRRSAGLEALAAGQRAMTIFRIVGYARDVHLTVRLASRLYARIFGDLAGTYRIAATSTEGSRLVARILIRYPTGAYGRALRRIVPTIDLAMFRKQLLTLKGYAERDARELRAGGAYI